MEEQFVVYIRVSTDQQGRSGLGIAAQRAAVHQFVAGKGRVVSEFVEVESGKGVHALNKRPQLRAALEVCERTSAKLVIAKLDRLARNVHFVTGLIESGCEFVAVDMPAANKAMLQMHAVMAEYERDQISQRTKAALSAAKARGQKLGAAGPVNLRPNVDARIKEADEYAARYIELIQSFRARALSQRRMVKVMNDLGITAPKGGRWSLVQVQRLIARTEAVTAVLPIRVGAPPDISEAVGRQS